MQARSAGRVVALSGLLVAACAPNLDGPAYPLYPSSSGERLPRQAVARLYGMLASVDGQDVSTLGGAYEVLPGCHEVFTRSHRLESTNYVSVTGGVGRRRLVLPTRAGYSYIVKQVASAGVTTTSSIEVRTFAEEIDPSGASTGYIPAKADATLAECKENMHD